MKKTLKLFVVLALLVCLLVGCGNTGTKEPEETDGPKPLKIGYTIIDLSNPVWATKLGFIEDMCAERGWEVTVLDCAMDASKQITQIENYITNQCDVIVIQAADLNALGDAVAKAHEAGIMILCDGLKYEDAEVSVINDNYGAGEWVGKACGEWITATYGDEAVEIGLFEYPFVPEGVDRSDGMKAGLKATAPNAVIIATSNAVDLTGGMNDAETMLQAHPEIKAFMAFGDGLGLAACEVLEGKGVDPAMYGVFSIDGTDEALAKIAGGTPFKMSCSLGSAKGQAVGIMEALEAMQSGSYEKIYYTPNIPIDTENVGEHYSK